MRFWRKSGNVHGSNWVLNVGPHAKVWPQPFGPRTFFFLVLVPAQSFSTGICCVRNFCFGSGTFRHNVVVQRTPIPHPTRNFTQNRKMKSTTGLCRLSFQDPDAKNHNLTSAAQRALEKTILRVIRYLMFNTVVRVPSYPTWTAADRCLARALTLRRTRILQSWFQNYMFNVMVGRMLFGGVEFKPEEYNVPWADHNPPP